MPAADVMPAAGVGINVCGGCKNQCQPQTCESMPATHVGRNARVADVGINPRVADVGIKACSGRDARSERGKQYPQQTWESMPAANVGLKARSRRNARVAIIASRRRSSAAG